MDHNNRNRRDNRLPQGLRFMMWPALARAPWLIDSFMESDDRQEAERRRKYRR